MAVLIAGFVVCAWFVVAIRGLNDQASVRAFLRRHPVLTATQARALDAMVVDAQLLDPDQSLNTLRALVQAQAHHLPRAVAIAQAIASSEPQNVGNWFTLRFLAGNIYPATYRLASARIRALAPPVPASR